MSSQVRERGILFSGPMVRALLREDSPKTQTRRVVKEKLDHADECKHPPRFFDAAAGGNEWACTHCGYGLGFRCPYGVPGDRLWVRETWAVDADLEQVRREHDDMMPGLGHGPYYRADPVHENTGLTWRPSIHMYRWMSRILLELTDVRVQRLQDISEEDAIAEGLIELVPPNNRGEGLSPGALAIAAAATVASMPRVTRRRFLAGAFAAALGFAAGAKPWEVAGGRFNRAPTARELYGVLFDKINGAGSWEANPWTWALTFKRITPA